MVAAYFLNSESKGRETMKIEKYARSIKRAKEIMSALRVLGFAFDVYLEGDWIDIDGREHRLSSKKVTPSEFKVSYVAGLKVDPHAEGSIESTIRIIAQAK